MKYEEINCPLNDFTSHLEERWLVELSLMFTYKYVFVPLMLTPTGLYIPV